MKELIVQVLSFLLLLWALPLSVSNVRAQETLVQFSPLQRIINDAPNGSTIVVEPGTYYGLIRINKTLTLIGTDVIIDANYSQVGMVISASNVKLKGFTIRNTVRYGNGSIPEEISELWIHPEMDGAGIYAYQARDLSVSNVKVMNVYIGLAIANSVSVEITNCTFSNATWGVMVSVSCLITISRSLITLNYDLPNNNGGGIWAGKHASITLTNSTISENLWGIVFLPGSVANEIHFNNFLNNTHQAHVHPDAGTVGSWTANYWSDHVGADLNLDGFIDTPYIIDLYNEDPLPLASDPPLTPMERFGHFQKLSEIFFMKILLKGEYW